MKMLGLVAASAAALSVAAAAQPVPPAQQRSAGGWRVENRDNYCWLVVDPEGRPPKQLTLRLQPGRESISLLTLDPRPGSRRTAVNPDDEVAVILQPSGISRIGKVARTFRLTDHSFSLHIYDLEGLMPHLATSTQLEVWGPQRRRQFQMSFPPPGEAVSALRGCEREMLVRWGMDPAAFARLRSRPVMDRMEPELTWRDYPQAAVAGRQTGAVVMRLDIDATGRATNCAAVVSSGVAVLDQASCTLLLQRTHFRPAIGEDGRPTQAPYVFRIEWRLPR